MTKRQYDLVRVATALLVATLSVIGAWWDSSTADEMAHIASGLVKIEHGRRHYFVEQAPLMNVICAAPLAIAGYRIPADVTSRQWRAGNQLLYASGYDARRILLIARLPVIAMLIALAFAVSAFVLRVTGNRGAAMLAFALTAFCPNLLGHGRLATVDVGVTLFLFLAAVSFLRLLREPTMRIAIACGLATAAALLSKTSGSLLVFFFAALVLIRYRDALRARRELVVAGIVAIATFTLFYMILLRSFDPRIGFEEYMNAVNLVRRYVTSPLAIPQFLLGEFSPWGWRHYYLVAILLKTTLAALLLLIAAIVAAVKRPRFESLAMFGFAVLFVAVASTSTMNIGLRHVLPIYPFLYAGIAITFAGTRREMIAPAVLVGCHVFAALLAYPSYISYFNLLIGNSRNADAFLLDSNVDWGQDLHRLAVWSGNEHIRVHYFGGGNIPYEFGARGEIYKAPRPEPLPKGLFAVSKQIYRISFSPGTRETYDHYFDRSHAKYVTTIGGSIDVYRVE